MAVARNDNWPATIDRRACSIALPKAIATKQTQMQHARRFSQGLLVLEAFLVMGNLFCLSGEKGR